MTGPSGRVWMITGSSSGLGAALARLAHAAGDTVVCAQRDPSALPVVSERVLGVGCDLTDPDSLEAAVAAALDRFGRIDVLVNNAGSATIGAVEETRDDEFREIVEVNLFGPLRLIQAVLPSMRERGSGWLIAISSIAGFVGLDGSASYSAGKFALEGLSEALAREMTPFGVRVLIVEPGGMRTDFRKRNLRILNRRVPAYEQTIGERAARARRDTNLPPGDPEKAALAIRAAIDAPQPPLRLALGRDAWSSIHAKLERWMSELTEWRVTSSSTDFDDGAP